VSNALDLYSKVEDLLGVNEVTPKLYRHYLLTLENLSFDSLLDVGCGRGDFLLQVQQKFHDVRLMGIDLSPLMVKKSQSKGIEAHCVDLCKLEQKFDVITAVFDMLNYLDSNALRGFMRCVEERLEEGGFFICDINSLYAFEELAVGSFIRDDDTRFVTIDSEFEDGEYFSEFTLFEKGNDGRFCKSQEEIMQYHYRVDALTKMTKMELLSQEPISIYGDEVEKHYLIFRR
jgi:cyclopropane fatty-acyl-phospholipid synthase-like methyltransferase